MNSDNNSKLYDCEICSKSFKHFSRLVQHIDCHYMITTSRQYLDEESVHKRKDDTEQNSMISAPPDYESEKHVDDMVATSQVNVKFA